jgi:DNA polymerase I-like protein with 3'-5' exonuclease and polymerase domains
MDARKVYSLHDEIIVETNADQEDTVAQKVQQCMEKALCDSLYS